MSQLQSVHVDTHFLFCHRPEVLYVYTPPPEPAVELREVVLEGAQNIDMAISNFQVQFDGKGDRFKPGDELSGKVSLFVKCFVFAHLITSVSACHWWSHSLNITPSPFLSLMTKFTYLAMQESQWEN